ncbi:MAG: DEAD/DEAH box helicase family protein [Acidobacteriota bacterium]|nr:DEAD/DEAH box helicase family protein [Acidobacteriota bacterium]
MSENPILNSPYLEPRLHYSTAEDGSLDYQAIIKNRRVFNPYGQVIPIRQGAQRDLGYAEQSTPDLDNHIVNLCRKEIGRWRNEKYPNTTRVSRELLTFWFNNPERVAVKKLFFAQQEAVETAIWLNEVAEKSNAGQHILNLLQLGQQSVSGEKENQLPRIAFKMATGSGKTVVMACLILYHYFNRQEYRNDTRFADYFLIVAPGITIKDRLGVLFVDTKNKIQHEIQDYYRIRDLVPKNHSNNLENLNARLVITNYHSFEPRVLQGNKKSPFDGKVNLEGKKIDTGNKEDFSLVVKRMLSNFKSGSRLLVLNDEAHHCYLPKSTGKTTDNEESDENAKAAVWFSGLRELAKRFKVQNIYDLSATPYYLQGSGYDAYSLFPWVVSDFGLIEAIEAGLVKIPFLPESDNSQELSQPILRNLYDHVRDQLPKKGRKTKKRDAHATGEKLKEEKPILPTLIKQAMDMFYNHYDEYDKGHRERLERRRDLFSPPPVFIIVCNNTSVSKEVYKYIAGYEYENEDGERVVISGAKDLFSNYDQYGKPFKRPPTLLIDSDALENSDQINDDFKKIFEAEIKEFKKDYARLHGQGSLENITDAQILREVVNTVGQQGRLGSHIRCVVSVSMLTEGWDANTVTHIMGIRAFGSQLLCEQVAGRALRRMNYFLQGYDKEGNPTDDKRKIVVEKFPPEYAHIIGVPFNMFKGGKTTQPTIPRKTIQIAPIPEQQKLFEITFPNVVGYRVENKNNELTYDFSGINNYDIDITQTPTESVMTSAFSPHEETMQVKSVLEKRDNELIFLFTKELIKRHFSDDDRNPSFQIFNRLKKIVEEWYHNKVRLIGIRGDQWKKLLYFHVPETIVDHIKLGINTHLNTSEHIRPVFNYYNQFGSTKYVGGLTTKDVYKTKRSHINYVVEDSGWEGIAAKTMEELPDKVVSYVKNQFLDFKIPYVKDGKDHDYYPDFIARYRAQDGSVKNLIVEISGFSKDKAEKKWYVENRWLPAVNSAKDKFGYEQWDFIEIEGDIRDIKNQLIDKFTRI